MILAVDPVDAVNIENCKDLVLESWPAPSVEFMAMNTTKKGLDDVRVRQAINYATNRQEFVDTIVEGRGEVATSVVAKTVPGWNEDVILRIWKKPKNFLQKQDMKMDWILRCTYPEK